MKHNTILIIALATLFAVGCQSANYDDHNQKSNKMFQLFKHNNPVEFESFCIRIVYMRCQEVFAGQKTENGVYLEHYTSNSLYNEETMEFEKNKIMIKAIDGGQELYDELCKLFGECKIEKWDGFSGANPRGVRDGKMMSFEATLTNGKSINADGSNNFPRTYKTLMAGLKEIFDNNESIKEAKPIVFETFRLEERGTMAESWVYTGEKTENGVHLEHFRASYHWDNEINDRVEDKTMIHAKDGDQQLYEALCKVMTDYEVSSWNGFDGYDPECLDGYSMTFDTKLVDGSTIHASGENKFPKNYYDLLTKIRELTIKED